MKGLKFPLHERPFNGAVALTPKQCHTFHSATRKIVAATFHEFDAFVRDDDRRMDAAKWKPVKTRDEVTVYKQLHSHHTKGSTAANGEPPTTPKRGSEGAEASWRMPKLVAVGTIAGTLDDIMYGIVTPDAAAIHIKTSYTHNELLDGAVLHEIKTATDKDPFRFLGLKWIAIGHPSVVNAVVRPRDFVFIESTGVNKLKDGTRVGFHVFHSVELPQCLELSQLSIIRARSSSCYLYRQLRPGVVEIYLTSRSDPGGNAPETIAIMSAANTLIGIWKAMWCAQNKKLAWFLTQDAAAERRRCRHTSVLDAAKHRVSVNDRRYCNVCGCKPQVRTFRGPIVNAKCRLCNAYVCAACRVARKLSATDQNLELRYHIVEVCKRCLVNVEMTSAFAVAHKQYAPKKEIAADAQPSRSPSHQSRSPCHNSPSHQSRSPCHNSPSRSSPSSNPHNSPASSSHGSDSVDDDDGAHDGKPVRVKIETIDDWQSRVVVMGSLPFSSRALTEL